MLTLFPLLIIQALSLDFANADDYPSGLPNVTDLSERLVKIYENRLSIDCGIPLASNEIPKWFNVSGDNEIALSEEEEEEDVNEDNEKDNKRIRIKNSFLIITGSTDLFEPLGTFECRAANSSLAYKAIRPLLLSKMKRSYSVSEGEDLRIHCQVKFPLPSSSFTLRWYVQSESENYQRTPILDNNYQEGQESHFKILSKDNVPNAVLKIEDATIEDRNIYICEGTTENEIVSVSTFVRVKDKYAALWPFLGIVSEVVFLCAVILLCEAKKTKSDEETLEEEDCTSGDVLSPGNNSSSLRQRK